MTSVRFARPETLEEAISLLVEHGDGAHVIAGGTSVVLMLKQGLIEPDVLVHLGRLARAEPALETACLDGAHVVIGGLRTLEGLTADSLIGAHLPCLATAVGRVATVRIRNQATIGGNLVHADPAQDPPPALLAHDAVVELTGPSGTRHVEAAAFFVDVFETVIAPDELLTAVRVPIPASASRFAYTKFLPRTADDYATVSIAARLDRADDGTIADARIALGNAGPTAFRALEAESSLRGRRPTPDTMRLAAALAEDAADPVDDVRGSAAFKRQMVGVWTARTLLDLVAGWDLA